ncbi:HDOD domain-containing protein [Pseudoalteromonas fenneropenaei]|uniref:HDOD domain-containing protein n=1 Tax=Pseudoalteromonas fenneropenaei TaxID=1737459 RepID=A0ABV7CLE2_9GAMM
MIEIDDTVLDDLRSGFSLPPQPEILRQLQKELSQPEPELFKVAQIISADIATSAAVLKVINSPAYGMARTVTDIRQAVMFLGMNCITQVVTGYLLKKAFNQDACCISLERFWDNATDISKVAMLIGTYMKSKVPIENLQLLGLFHDAGIPAMAMRYANYHEVLTRAEERTEHSLEYYEQQHFVTTHTVVGFFLASSWHLPKNICQMILRHHDPEFLRGTIPQIDKQTFAALKLAENLVCEAKRFRSSADWFAFRELVLLELDLQEDEYNDIKEDAEEIFIVGG